MRLAPRVFRSSRWRKAGLQSRFDARPLMEEIQKVVRERTLDTPDLLTRLGVVTKWLDTASPWVITNSPAAPFWEDPPDGAYIGNRRYKLKALIRASTAAPYFFAPQLIEVLTRRRPGLFVDGGVSPYNTPAMLLAMVATSTGHGFGWPLGAERLSLVSVGTGRSRDRIGPDAPRRMLPASLALRALRGLITDGQTHALAMCQWLGECDAPWPIDARPGVPTGPRPTPLFRFQRFDVELEQDWLARKLNMRISSAEERSLRRMDDPAIIPLAYRIGCVAAERQMIVSPLPALPAASVDAQSPERIG